MASGSQLRVFLAGRVAVEANGHVIDEARFPGRQGRLLFAYLVAEQGGPVPRDELAEALWGEAPPATWDKALTVIVSKLRGLLADSGHRRRDRADGRVRLLPARAARGNVGRRRRGGGRGARSAEEALAAGDLGTAKAAAALAASLAQQPFLPGDDGLGRGEAP